MKLWGNKNLLSSHCVGPLSVDRYVEIDDEVDVEQCSDSEAARNTRRTTQTSLASPSCASDEERLTPDQIVSSVSSGKNELKLKDGQSNLTTVFFVTKNKKSLQLFLLLIIVDQNSFD